MEIRTISFNRIELHQSNLASIVAGIIIILFSLIFVMNASSLLGIILTFIGIFPIMFGKYTKIIIDKESGLIQINWKSLFKHKTWSIRISDVKSVELRRTRSGAGEDLTVSDKLGFLLKNDTWYLLEPYNAFSSYIGRMRLFSNMENLGGKIAGFINVPFNNNSLSNNII